MRNKLLYSFDKDLKESLQNPAFKKAWDESEPKWKLARQIIQKRLAQKMSQRDLARKMKTTQAVVSRVETVNANPSLDLIKRFATALNTSFNLTIQ